MVRCQATFLGGAEATIISFILTASDKNHAWKAAVVMAYVVIILSMFIAMLSALFGVFCTREKLLTPYKVEFIFHHEIMHGLS
jgi:predicted benzoate:H+ symporter BenE